MRQGRPRFDFAFLFSYHRLKLSGTRDTERLYLLDALRGVAAMAVLIFHYPGFFIPAGHHSPASSAGYALPLRSVFAPFYRHGDFAVAVFWMLSGFVFSSVYYDRVITLRAFAVNRFARLYPLHLLTLLLVALIQLRSLSVYGGTLLGDNAITLHNFILQLFLASNWFKAEQSFNDPIWSVSVEVVIYALFWSTRTILPKRGLLGPAVLSALFLLPTIMFQENQIGPCGFYFFLGVTLAFIASGLRLQTRLLTTLILLMAVVGLAGFWTGSNSIQRGVGIPGVFGGLILALAALEVKVPATARKKLGLIGDNSYGMYLWHVPIQLVTLFFLTPFVDFGAVSSNPLFLLGFLVVVFAVARVSFVYFERPARVWLRRFGEVQATADVPKVAAP